MRLGRWVGSLRVILVVVMAMTRGGRGVCRLVLGGGSEGVSDELRAVGGCLSVSARLRCAQRWFPGLRLEVFGVGDETGRLRSVARQPRFREAVR